MALRDKTSCKMLPTLSCVVRQHNHTYTNMFRITFILLSTLLLQVFPYQLDTENLHQNHRVARQLGLGNILGTVSNKVIRNGPACEGLGGRRGKCLPMEQCVLKELDDDYVKNKEFFCAIRRQGPVGVCCPDSITKPVVYREGIFGVKNTIFSRADGLDAEVMSDSTTPDDVEML